MAARSQGGAERPHEAVDLRSLRSAVAAAATGAWRQPGFCVPNREVYPHQWLWDSCFHAVIWAVLGSDRGVVEVETALANQGGDGFVPHMTYWTAPDLHAEFWGRRRVSSITQPPMYGHAVAELVRHGLRVPEELVERASAGLAHLDRRDRTGGGLVPVFHPWETGCDDSPRWDDWLADPGRTGPQATSGEHRSTTWRRRKGELVACLTLGADGQAVGSRRFAVGSVGFNALVAWNAAELAEVAPDPDGSLAALAEELAAAVAARWDGDRWVDDVAIGPEGPPTSAGARTIDAMTALLVDPRPEGFDALIDPDAFGAPFGPRGMHRAESSYDPDCYWRGPAWPQLTYLVMLAAERAGRGATTAILAEALVAGATTSGFSEHWNPETGVGGGARPQTWAGLALAAADRLR